MNICWKVDAATVPWLQEAGFHKQPHCVQQLTATKV